MIKLKTPNSMEIAGQPAVITYVPELNAFRGKFLGLSGYCDFVSDSIQGLQKEGGRGFESRPFRHLLRSLELSLEVFFRLHFYYC